VFRLNFDNPAELQGIYVDYGDTLQTVSGGIGGNGERFDGISDIAIPFFKNNEFREFTLSLWFNRNASGGAGQQGLVSNGNVAATGCSPATIEILSTDTTVSATVLTASSTASITHGSTVCK
jgi:hypothetical protein